MRSLYFYFHRKCFYCHDTVFSDIVMYSTQQKPRSTTTRHWCCQWWCRYEDIKL